VIFQGGFSARIERWFLFVHIECLALCARIERWALRVRIEGLALRVGFSACSSRVLVALSGLLCKSISTLRLAHLAITGSLYSVICTSYHSAPFGPKYNLFDPFWTAILFVLALTLQLHILPLFQSSSSLRVGSRISSPLRKENVRSLCALGSSTGVSSTVK
jgi:hypothetical protein